MMQTKETNQSRIKFKRSPVYTASKKAFFEGWPIICNEGGSRSGKTYSVLQLLIIIAAIKKPGVRISIVSHSLPHIKRGAYRDFKAVMDHWKMWDDNEFSYSDFVYHFPNGSYIELFGLEDESKARGPGRDILFVNEANLISKPLFDQLAMRTTGQIFLDWNPADFNSWVYEIADDPKNKRIHSTYRNNLSNLSEMQVSLIESYKKLPDDFMWKVYGLGQRGAAKELIYTQWKMYDDEPEGGDVFYGLDFGYTNPAAMVKVRHYEGANYVEEVLYKPGLTNSDLIQIIKEAGTQKHPIYADCAEPKSIEELYKVGLNVLPSDKDVWAGIVGVKSYPLFVKRGSENLISELQGYKWKKDKNDNVLEEPIKAKDHLCDAMRYAVFTHLTKPVFKVGAY
jgi:phage terminase large subunit